LALALGAVAVALAILAVAMSTQPTTDAIDVAALAVFVALLSFPLTGTLLAARRPRNPIGWLFLTVGIAFFGSITAEEYAVRALVTEPGSLPGGPLAGWLASWVWMLSLGPLPLAVLLFPDGRPPGPRWRLALAGMVVWMAGLFLIEALVPARFLSDRLEDVANPFAIEALAPLREPIRGIRDVWGTGLVIFLFVAIIGLGVRLRRARGLERLQLRSFAYAVALIATISVGGVLLSVASALSGVDLTAAEDVLWIALIASLSGLPIGAAIAILRYRLYDIDVLINRTLVYGSVSALLIAIYAGAVLLLQTSLRPFTSGSELAVAGSTLAVVALFQPLRRRVQGFVDRRFYRSRYDAARTLDAFGARLRNEVELDSVRADLLGVIRETVRPAHASLWLRERAP